MNDERAMLPQVPLIDALEGGPLRHAREGCKRARALRDECLAFLPGWSRAAMPLLDGLARRWLRRSRSPYIAEIEAIATTLGFNGVWFLNGSYQWGCTTLARGEYGAPWLARTLDWPFPGLGRNAEVAHMRGPAGDFFNVTWPGYVGTLTAMAPRRFAAAVNQAPLRRRARHPWLRVYDMTANAFVTWARVRHIPPDQLLRHVFETCADYASARDALERTPVARPVIYTLVGCGLGERCVIERTEETFETHTEETAAANDWRESRPGWEARIAARHFFTLSTEGAAGNSRARRQALAGYPDALDDGQFGWVTPPVLNGYTRIAVSMCPARALMHVAGFETEPGSELPQPVTLTRTVNRESCQERADERFFL